MITVDPTLVTLLAGRVPLLRTELFVITLQNGTVYDWTSWSSDLTISGTTYSAMPLKRGKISVTNTMSVPSLALTILSLNTAFAGGADLKSQIHNGLFDGAKLTLYKFFMQSPADRSLPPVKYFGGGIGQAQVIGNRAELVIKGGNNRLDQYAPRNVYQVGCAHAFCDANCTLLRASFTFSFTVGASPTRTFVPWSSAPATPSRFQLGTINFTSGAASGQSRNIAKADSTGLTLRYPLYVAPAPGDSFTAFQGCDKTQTTCNVTYNNLQNWRAFPFVPPAELAV